MKMLRNLLIPRTKLHPFSLDIYLCWLKNEVRTQAGIFRTRHHRAQEYSFKITTVISQMTVRLTEGRNNLWHLKPELTVFICQGSTMTLRFPLVPFSCLCLYVNTLTSKRSTVNRITYGAAHPETAPSNAINNGGIRVIVI